MWHWMFVILKQQICGKHLKHDFCESICNTGFCGNVWESDGLAGIQKDVIWHREAFASFVAFASSNKNAPAVQQKCILSICNKNASSVFATKRLFQYLQSNKNASSVFAVQQKCIQQYLQQKCTRICQKKSPPIFATKFTCSKNQVWNKFEREEKRYWDAGEVVVALWEWAENLNLELFGEDIEMVVGLWECAVNLNIEMVVGGGSGDCGSGLTISTQSIWMHL